LALSSCQSWYGPSALQDTHPSYNQAIVNSLSQEMLLNLVRLKYRDRPFFLRVNSVTASMSLKSSIGINGSDTNIISPNAGISFSQTPTISYAPLGGEDFLKSVLSPISLQAVLIMAQSGWSVERVFGLSIERINNLENAPSASGPTPYIKPEYEEFSKLLKAFSYLHSLDLIEIGVNTNSHQSIDIHFLPTEDKKALLALKKVQSLLKLNGSNVYHFSTNFLRNHSESLNLRLRSISGILYYLSQNIDVPEEHMQLGLVTNTVTPKGEIFDWGQTPAGKLFSIKNSPDKPDNAYLSIFYRDTWFYIADYDLNSKSTFMLLTQLFNLQAGQSQVAPPTLTIPVGIN